MSESSTLPSSPQILTPNRHIAVFCGSSAGVNPAHKALAHALGASIADNKARLIYGGGGLGLMGTVARAAHFAGGDVLGIIPEFLQQEERTLTEVKHRIVPDMHTRKTQMYDESDAFVVLPGGVGTLEEAVEIISWLRLSLHAKPVIFLSDTGYWDGLMRVFRQTMQDGFTPSAFESHLHEATTAQEALEKIEALLIKTPPILKSSITPDLSDV